MVWSRIALLVIAMSFASCSLGYDTAGDEERLEALKARFGDRYDFKVSLDEGKLRAIARDGHQPSREEALQMFNMYFADEKSTSRNSEVHFLCVCVAERCSPCIHPDPRTKKPEIIDH